MAVPTQEQQRYEALRALECMKREKREHRVMLQPVADDALAAQLSRQLSMLADATTSSGDSQDSSSSDASVEDMTGQLMAAHTRLQQLQHAQLAHPRSAASNLSPPPADLQLAVAAVALTPTLVPSGARRIGAGNSISEESSGGNSVKITVPMPRPNSQQPQSPCPTLQPPRSPAATAARHSVNHTVAHAASAPVVVPTQQLSRVNAAMSSPAAPQAVAGSRDDSSNSRGNSNGSNSCASTDSLGGSDELMFDLSGSPPERWSSPPRHSPSPPAGQRSAPFNPLHQQQATGVTSDADGPDWSWPVEPNDGAQDGLLLSSSLSLSPQEPFFRDSPTSTASSSLSTEVLHRFRSVSDELAIGEPTETRAHASLSSSFNDVDDADMVTECREHFAHQRRSVTQSPSHFDHTLNEALGLLLTRASPAELRRIHASLKLLMPRVEEKMLMAGPDNGDDDVVILSASVPAPPAVNGADNIVAPQPQNVLPPPQAPPPPPAPARAQSAGTKRKSNEVAILMDNWAMQRDSTASASSSSTSVTSGSAAAASLQPTTKRRKSGAYATAQSSSDSRSNVAATGASAAAAVATAMVAPVLAGIVVTAAAPSSSSAADRSARNASPKKPAQKSKKVAASSAVSTSGDANGAATSKKKSSIAPKKTQKKVSAPSVPKHAQPEAKVTSTGDDFLESPSPPTTDVRAATAPAAAATAAAVQKSPSQAAISTSATTSEQFNLNDGCEAAPEPATPARAAAPPSTRFFAQHSASKSKNLLTPGKLRSAGRKAEASPSRLATRSTLSSSIAPMEDDDDQPLLPATSTTALPTPRTSAAAATAAFIPPKPDVKNKESSLLQTVYNKKRNGVPSIVPSTSSQATVGVQMLRAEVEPGKATMVMGALVPVAVPTMAAALPVGQQESDVTCAPDQQLALLPSMAPAPCPAAPVSATPATMVTTEHVSLLSEWTTEDVSEADDAPASAPPLDSPKASAMTNERAEPLMVAVAAGETADAEGQATLPPPQPQPQLSLRSKTVPKSLTTAQEQKDQRKEDVADKLFKAVQERQLSTAASTAEISSILGVSLGTEGGGVIVH
jgi:hypothetical protein